jgi:hypothetical protein
LTRLFNVPSNRIERLYPWFDDDGMALSILSLYTPRFTTLAPSIFWGKEGVNIQSLKMLTKKFAL